MLDSIMEFVKVGNAGKFNTAIYHKLLRAIVSLVSYSFLFVVVFFFIIFCHPSEIHIKFLVVDSYLLLNGLILEGSV